MVTRRDAFRSRARSPGGDGRLTSSERLYGLGGQCLAADPPIAAFDFVDLDPGHTAHVLAFDRYHRIGESRDHLRFLLGSEHVLDYAYLNQRHCKSPCPVKVRKAGPWISIRIDRTGVMTEL